MTTKEELFQEIDLLLKRLQHKGDKVTFSSQTTLVCCERMFGNAEEYWRHLRGHTKKELLEIKRNLEIEIAQGY